MPRIIGSFVDLGRQVIAVMAEASIFRELRNFSRRPTHLRAGSVGYENAIAVLPITS